MARSSTLLFGLLLLLAFVGLALADERPPTGNPVPNDYYADVCVTNLDCEDKNSCTTDVCIGGLCQHLFSGGQFCCQRAQDCPEAKCRVRGCNPHTLRCAYQYDTSCGPPPQSSGSPDAGDLVGAIIGIIILGLLVIAFVCVILLLIVRNIIRKIRE